MTGVKATFVILDAHRPCFPWLTHNGTPFSPASVCVCVCRCSDVIDWSYSHFTAENRQTWLRSLDMLPFVLLLVRPTVAGYQLHDVTSAWHRRQGSCDPLLLTLALINNNMLRLCCSCLCLQSPDITDYVPVIQRSNKKKTQKKRDISYGDRTNAFQDKQRVVIWSSYETAICWNENDYVRKTRNGWRRAPSGPFFYHFGTAWGSKTKSRLVWL